MTRRTPTAPRERSIAQWHKAARQWLTVAAGRRDPDENAAALRAAHYCAARAGVAVTP